MLVLLLLLPIFLALCGQLWLSIPKPWNISECQGTVIWEDHEMGPNIFPGCLHALSFDVERFKRLLSQFRRFLTGKAWLCISVKLPVAVPEEWFRRFGFCFGFLEDGSGDIVFWFWFGS